jgi:hypothetical protein
VPATVSGPGPGDYPLGSLESRAAARAMIEARERLNAIPDNLTEEEMRAQLRRMTTEELEADVALSLGKTIAELQQMTDEEWGALIEGGTNERELS